MFIFVLGQNISILIESSSGPSKKQNKVLLCLNDASLYVYRLYLRRFYNEASYLQQDVIQKEVAT